MSKAGKKLIEAAKEAVQIAKGDTTAIKYARFTPSCGCVFCDVKCEPENGKHFVPAHSGHPDQWIECTNTALRR